MLQLMQKMELLLSKTPAADVKSEVLPLLYRALECDVQQIQELCLSVLPSCAHLVESHAMKNALLPRVKKLCVATSYLSVSLPRRFGLVCDIMYDVSVKALQSVWLCTLFYLFVLAVGACELLGVHGENSRTS